MSKNESGRDRRGEPLKGPVVPGSPLYRMLEMAARAVATRVRQKTANGPIESSSVRKEKRKRRSP